MRGRVVTGGALKKFRTTGMGPEKADTLAKLEAWDPKQSGGIVELSDDGRGICANVRGLRHCLSTLKKDMLTKEFL